MPPRSNRHHQQCTQQRDTMEHHEHHGTETVLSALLQSHTTKQADGFQNPTFPCAPTRYIEFKNTAYV